MRLFIFLSLCLAVTVGAFADATREYKTSTTLGKLGSKTSTVTDYFSVDRHTGDTEAVWSAGLMKTVTRGKAVQSSVITRLDRDSVYTVKHNKKTYSVMSLAEFREMLKKGLEDTEGAKAEEEDADSADGENSYDWTIEDLSDPNAKEIRGWNCRNAKIVATGIHKVDSLDKVVITFDFWVSEDVPGAEEIEVYVQNYLAALGMNELALTEGLLTVADLYANKLAEVMSKAKEMRGESVQALMKIEHNRRKGKSLGKQAKEGAADELGKQVPFGLGKKKKKDEKPVYVMKAIFSLEQDLMSATTSAVDVVKFEAPAEYKRKNK